VDPGVRLTRGPQLDGATLRVRVLKRRPNHWRPVAGPSATGQSPGMHPANLARPGTGRDSVGDLRPRPDERHRGHNDRRGLATVPMHFIRKVLASVPKGQGDMVAPRSGPSSPCHRALGPGPGRDSPVDARASTASSHAAGLQGGDHGANSMATRERRLGK
jgi:hypothetical protein